MYAYTLYNIPSSCTFWRKDSRSGVYNVGIGGGHSLFSRNEENCYVVDVSTTGVGSLHIYWDRK